MNLQVLLDENPKTATVIRQWLLEKMLESLNDKRLPEDFKEVVKKEGITDDKVVGILESNPRALFDVFDNHKVFITIHPVKEESYSVKINDQDLDSRFLKRIDADAHAVMEAFKILEDKL